MPKSVKSKIYRTKVSRILHAARRKRKLTGEQVAKKLGRSRRTIYGWEAGRSTPSVKCLRELAKLYRLAFSRLLV